MPSNTPLFARQAIYDRKKNVVAYELLFRHSHQNEAVVVDADQATSHVLLNVFGERSIDEIIQEKKAFINFTENLIKVAPPLPSEKLVIEVLENVKATDEVIESLSKLKKAGFEIALDDFFINRDTQKLLKVASIIKIDVLALNKKELTRYVAALRPLKIKLLAEKIEDHEMMALCLELGFDYFQGYFLCRPEIISGAKTNEGKQAVLRLLGTLNDPETPFDDIVSVIASDPSLSYKILRLVNSSAIGLPREIESLNQAIVMLGLKNIRNWVNFLLLANNEHKPKELSAISLVRAKFAENLCRHIDNGKLAESAFITGLLSNLEAFLDITLNHSVLTELKLAKPIQQALLEKEGVLGLILAIVLHYERGQWSKINWDFLAQHDLTDESVNQLYQESIIWSAELLNSF